MHLNMQKGLDMG